jgi:PAS domain S-box-containing protein
METLTGASRAELIGGPFDALFADPAAAREGLRRVLAEGRVTDYELVVATRDGREVPVSYNATTYFNAGGELQGVFAAARDITARERALQQANLSLEAFAYSVSHDLRAPLRALSGFADALVEEFGARLGETGRDYAERIQRASERMGLLIDDLLGLSALARAELRMERVDLSRLARSVAAELQREEPARRVAFEIADGEWAQADPLLIRTVLENLLGNAWKFTSRRPDATIEFGGAAAGPGWRTFFVRDNGVGFDPAYKDRLFRPFERLHSTADFPGSGIGLASVARVVERHGGRAWADWDPARGTTFSFTLRTDTEWA